MMIRQLVRYCLFVLFFAYCAVSTRAQDGCRTGGKALAEAYVRSIPIYAYYLGDLESYVSENDEHFVEEGDAVRCAQALSRAFLTASVQLFDPSEIKRNQEYRDRLNAQLGSVGLAPESQGPSITQSGQFYQVSAKLARLARVLPAAADGDFVPLHTASNDQEQLEELGARMLQELVQDATSASVLQQFAPLYRQLAELEKDALLQAANHMARQSDK